MHIEPGVVEGAKLIAGYATAAGVLLYAAKQSVSVIRKDGIAALGVRSLMSAILVFCFFEVLPHYPVGVSEVHFILGSTLFLIFGTAPAALGLAAGLLIQGVFLAPADLPQYGMNVTSLLAPLFIIHALARRIIPENTAYKDVEYKQALMLSTAYQGGVITWVAIWASLGGGFGAENLLQIASFGTAYMLVIVVEPIADLAVLAAAKSMHRLKDSMIFHSRLYSAATVS